MTSHVIATASTGDPLMVVASLANPGGNITGLSGYTTGSEEKRAEVVKELVPGAVRIAGLYNMGNPVFPPLWNELQTAARKLGLTPQLLDGTSRLHSLTRPHNMYSHAEKSKLYRAIGGGSWAVCNLRLEGALIARAARSLHRLRQKNPAGR